MRASFAFPREPACRTLVPTDVAQNRQAGEIGRVSDDVNEGGPALLAAGAVLGGVAVALGAFGAHALTGRISAEALGWWHTAVEYQMWHALAVVALALSGRSFARLPAWLFVVGAAVFSTTLYAMVLGAPHWLGAVTPLGGIAMIAGWALLASRALRN
jgi:uncharacterized membrane protein YgdD (TMEM256/DUF423 family)